MKKLFKSIVTSILIVTLSVGALTVVPSSTAIQSEAGLGTIITVIKVATSILSKLELKKNSVTLKSGDKYKISFNNVPKDKELKYEFSTKSKYVTVNSNGVVTPKKGAKGTATITVTVTIPIDGADDISKDFTFKVDLKDKNNPDYTDIAKFKKAMEKKKNLDSKTVKFTVKKVERG